MMLNYFQTCTHPAPMSHDPQAKAERDRIDYNIRITKQMGEQGTGKIY